MRFFFLFLRLLAVDEDGDDVVLLLLLMAMGAVGDGVGRLYMMFGFDRGSMGVVVVVVREGSL